MGKITTQKGDSVKFFKLWENIYNVNILESIEGWYFMEKSPHLEISLKTGQVFYMSNERDVFLKLIRFLEDDKALYFDWDETEKEHLKFKQENPRFFE